MSEHDYYCDCAECEAAMKASIDRLNATLEKIDPGGSKAFVVGPKGRYPHKASE